MASLPSRCSIKFYRCTELRKHVVDTKMSLFHVLLCFLYGNLSEFFFILFTQIDTYLFNAGQNDQFICVQFFCKLTCCQVLFNYSTGAFQTVILFQYRNTTASACDNYLICIDQGLDCLNLNNTNRIRCRYNSSEIPYPVLLLR